MGCLFSSPQEFTNSLPLSENINKSANDSDFKLSIIEAQSSSKKRGKKYIISEKQKYDMAISEKSNNSISN
jgi:hypothetical protein